MLDPIGAWKFWRTLRGERFAIVHQHYGGRSVTSLARAATHAKIVWHLHGRILEPKGLELVSSTARGADAVIAVSRAVAGRVAGGAVRVIYSGVALPPQGAPRHHTGSTIVLGTAGRLVKLKGVEYLLRAMDKLRNEFPSMRLEIAGSGPEREKLKAAVARAGLERHVKFLGWVDNITNVLSSWDIFVMPSLEEGFPIAALDAMAAGLPVVATLVGGIPELVEDGVTGWLVPARDVESLISRLRLLLHDPGLRVRMGEAGYARVQDHFSAAQMRARIARLYDELLDKGRT
jgi:glycosyltransferase involved in cell wall biosynthesis